MKTHRDETFEQEVEDEVRQLLKVIQHPRDFYSWPPEVRREWMDGASAFVRKRLLDKKADLFLRERGFKKNGDKQFGSVAKEYRRGAAIALDLSPYHFDDHQE